MAPTLHDVTDVRGWLTDSLLAYLSWVLRDDSTPPSYHPQRLGAGVLHSLWRRLHVRLHRESDDRVALDRHAPADASSDRGYAPRRRTDDDRLGDSPRPTPDEETASRHPRAVIVGEPGAGKTWLLRRIAYRTAHEGLVALGRERTTLTPDVAWPIRVRLPEVAESQGPLDDVLARAVYDRAQQGFAVVREPGDWGALAEVARRLSGVSPEVSPRFESFARAAIAGGRAVVLLDAWDEVTRTSRTELQRRLVAFAQAHPKARILVTTRDGAGFSSAWLKPPAQLGERPADLELLALDPPQVKEFVREWFKDFPGPRLPATELQAVLDQHPPMQELARNPLMLTFMTRVAEQSSDIPTRRVELYARVLRGLLVEWPAARPDRIEDGVAYDDHVMLLARVAHALLEAGQLNEFAEHTVCALIEESGRDTTRSVGAMARERSDAVLALWKGTGVLVPWKPGHVAFLHRTFQEYLAGIALVADALANPTASQDERAAGVRRCVDALTRRLEGTDAERAIWMEPIRLGLGHLGLIAGQPDECSEVVLGVMRRAPGPAGRAVADMGNAVAEISWRTEDGAPAAAQGVTAPCRAAVVERVMVCMGGGDVGAVRSDAARPARTPRAWVRRLLFRGRAEPSPTATAGAMERAACGGALAKLGDPRFHDDALACLPKDDLLGFVLVEPPDGDTFLMGSGAEDADAHDNERPLQPVRLDEAFYLARWPVTVQQFALFTLETGYDAGEEWSSGAANHPVANVSWHDAVAYCAWLTGRLQGAALPPLLQAALETLDTRDTRRTGWRVTLPTEAQWEWAARGEDRHVYPSPRGTRAPGVPLTPERANYDETHIGTTSTVGCFRLSASWCGVEDMAGNVLEWTRSRYRPYSTATVDAEDAQWDGLDDDDEDRVLRGGSFNFIRRLARAAYRYHFEPADRNDVGFRVALCPFRS